MWVYPFLNHHTIFFIWIKDFNGTKIIPWKEGSVSIVKDNTVFKGSTFVINRFTYYSNLVKTERLTFHYPLLLNLFPGNETNYKTKWGAFSQKKVGKGTEYWTQMLNPCYKIIEIYLFIWIWSILNISLLL